MILNKPTYHYKYRRKFCVSRPSQLLKFSSLSPTPISQSSPSSSHSPLSPLFSNSILPLSQLSVIGERSVITHEENGAKTSI